MDPSALPTPHHADAIGDDTWSVINWLSALPELLPWIGVGFLFGGGIVLSIIGGPIAAGEPLPKWLGLWLASIGPIMIAAAAIGVYVASRWFRKHEDRKKRQVRAEKHDEMIESVERDKEICLEQFKQNRLLREELFDERKTLRAIVESEYISEIEQNQRAMLALWTQDAIKERVAITLEAARFTDNSAPECALLLRWKVVSIVGIPHVIEFLGGACDLHPLSGSPVEYFDLRPQPSISLDGKLSPNELSMLGIDHKAVITSAQQSAVRAELRKSDVARLTIGLKCSVTANGNIVPIDVVVPSVLVTLPAWVKL